jgi:hypothetical protein
MDAAVGWVTVKIFAADADPETATPVLLWIAESGKYVPVAVVNVPCTPTVPPSVSWMLFVVPSKRRVELPKLSVDVTKLLLPRSMYPACVPVPPLAKPVTLPVHWPVVGVNVSSSFPVVGAVLLVTVTVPATLKLEAVCPGHTEPGEIVTGNVTPMRSPL